MLKIFGAEMPGMFRGTNLSMAGLESIVCAAGFMIGFKNVRGLKHKKTKNNNWFQWKMFYLNMVVFSPMYWL